MPPFFRHFVTKRDITLVLIGFASSLSIYLLSSFNSQFGYDQSSKHPFQLDETGSRVFSPSASNKHPECLTSAHPTDISLSAIPETKVIHHAPGWTLFQNLYMSNGTLFFVTSHPGSSDIPPKRMMLSKPLWAYATPENIAEREATDMEMSIITPDEANRRWGGDVARGERHRIWSVDGNTILCNDPAQFLDHYYHFVAELLFGAWAFFYGSVSTSQHTRSELSSASLHPSSSFNIPYKIAPGQSSNDPSSTNYLPSIRRLIFMHATAQQWRDRPGFDAYIARAAFPSMSIETTDDWADRVIATHASPNHPQRAWHFPFALLTDRSASFRGDACGGRTHRIAAEAFEYMLRLGAVDPYGRWWGPIRRAVLHFANAISSEQVVEEEAELADAPLHMPDRIQITYISRQGGGRRLTEQDHEALVASLEELVERKREEGKIWKLEVIRAETLTKDEQLKIVGRTTVMLGVHGNGLTHLVFMRSAKISTVIEMFYPGGYVHDYEWTATALGMKHYGVWNDSYFTGPDLPVVTYPDGFHSSEIPAHGPTVATLIEKCLEGKL